MLRQRINSKVSLIWVIKHSEMLELVGGIKLEGR